MRVDDRYHASSFGPQLFLHLLGVLEESVIPCEVPLPVRVLDVQPEHVVRVVELFELPVHVVDIGFVLVIPPALMVSQAEHRRQRHLACQCSILAVEVLRRGARDEEQIHDAAFADPMRRLPVVRLVIHNVHKRFRRVEPECARSPCRQALADDERHSTVQRHRNIEVVLEHVQVVETVRIRVLLAWSGRRLQFIGRCVLRKSEQVLRTGKADIHADAHRTERFGIRMALEGLFPHALSVQLVLRELPVRIGLFHLALFARPIGINCKAVFPVANDFLFRCVAILVGGFFFFFGLLDFIARTIVILVPTDFEVEHVLFADRNDGPCGHIRFPVQKCCKWLQSDEQQHPWHIVRIPVLQRHVVVGMRFSHQFLHLFHPRWKQLGVPRGRHGIGR
mmetsp:Transcript_14975/g.42310  ORF Transcript_14975/g.42310 Transcript_14975/m.42310 type:complete len:393 (+) Transcript_14975:1702-2880(+)